MYNNWLLNSRVPFFDACSETTKTRRYLIDVKEAWEYSFQALEGLLLDGVVEGVVGSTATKRLLWLIDPEKQMVDVIEQCLSKSGQWSPGKAVNLEKLKYYHQHEQFDYLSAEDKRAANCIE